MTTNDHEYDWDAPPEDESEKLPMWRDPTFRRLLQLRLALSKASTAKFKALLKGLGKDGRVKSLLMYHGTSTGRWSAKRFQPQNLPSRDLAIDADEVEDALRAAKVGMLADLYDDVTAVASACLRGQLIAGPGNRYTCADYSAIEGRVLAWLAGEAHVIAAYVQGLRLYCVAASGIYGESYEAINKGRKHDHKYKQMDLVGKVVELACGYQGALGAFKAMAKNYALDLPDADIKEAVANWRASRPATVALWHGVEEAAKSAVLNPGELFEFRGVKFRVIGKFLIMRLPSGSYLYYYRPRMEPKEMPWKDDEGKPVVKDCLAFDGMDSKTHKWGRQFTYGGSLVENAVQRLARDIMAGGMLRLEAAGYTPELSVHDEILSEDRIGFGSVEEFCRIMAEVPEWAPGLPLAAEGWEGPRYKK